MVKKRRGLGGLGVDVLLSAANSTRDTSVDSSTNANLRNLPVEMIRRGKFQPRIHMRDEALQDLAASIRAQGVVQPVVVRPLNQGDDSEGYELIAGERRWRASQLAGLETIPAVIKDVTDQAAAAMALIENIQREDLNPLEEATAINRLIIKFELTHQEIADSVGRSRTAVSNLLRLLELTDEVKKMVDDGGLEMGHARALLGLTGRQQVEAAHQVVSQGLSVRATEHLVSTRNSDVKQDTSSEKKKMRDSNIERLEQTLSDTLGAPVSIQHRKGGKGKLLIQYSSLEELDGIMERLR